MFYPANCKRPLFCCNIRIEKNKVRTNHNPYCHLKKTKNLYLPPLGHHLLSSLRLSGSASLHSAVPEVTPAHDSRHADSLTAKEKTLSLRKNGKKTDTDRMWEAWKGVGVGVSFLMTAKSLPLVLAPLSHSETQLTGLTFDWQAGYPTTAAGSG